MYDEQEEGAVARLHKYKMFDMEYSFQQNNFITGDDENSVDSNPRTWTNKRQRTKEFHTPWNIASIIKPTGTENTKLCAT